ncbi:MAG: CvpA family protein [Oscillospiraceae bacterium]|nr:CvpA family protein [Oscillospiraceae bacterium]
MGQNFAFIFDIAIIAIIVGLTFAGAKKGFAKIILEMAAVVVATLCAVALSEPLAGQIYESFVKQPAEEFLENSAESLDELLNVDYFGGKNLDFDKVKIDGEYTDSFEPDYAGKNSAVIDLTNKVVDLSETGLAEIDLSFFGIEKGEDLSSVSVKTVECTINDEKKYGVGMLVAAQYIASCSVRSGAAEPWGDLLNELSAYLPSDFISGTSGVTVSTISGVVLAMLDTRTTAKSAIMEGIIEPNCTTIIRTILFAIIFILAMVILNVIIYFAGWLNKVPVVGKANEFLGGVAGFLESAAVVLIVCVVTRFIVSLCSGTNIILFNETAIESTFLFKHIYNLDLIIF